MRNLVTAFALALALPTVAWATPSRSVRAALGAKADYPSGFRTNACEDVLSLLGGSLDDFAALDLGERIRRTHGLCQSIQSSGHPPLAMIKDISMRLSDLATVDYERLTPFRNELLVVIARAGAVLTDYPGRGADEYYGVRNFVEKVVNLRHDKTPATHALIAHALARLAELRVSRLRHVVRFDEQIREAFEDLERLQREDTLGDGEFLRLHTSLAVFARVIPAFSMYDAGEQRRRVIELLERLAPVEDAVKALINRKFAAGDTRVTSVLEKLDMVLRSSGLEQVPVLRQRLIQLRDVLLNRPIGPAPQR